MVVKIYISGISASKEVKKRQQRAQFILDSCKINYEKIDITEPGFEEEKQRMKEVCKKRNDQPALPPQFFNDDVYCGDWSDFEIASEEDNLLEFLNLKEQLSEKDANGEGDVGIKEKDDQQIKDENEDDKEDGSNDDGNN